VSKFPRIINVSGISMEARDKQDASATITTECTATTFVLVEPSAAVPDKPKRGGRAAKQPAAKPSN
jgi:hypothetical protein